MRSKDHEHGIRTAGYALRMISWAYPSVTVYVLLQKLQTPQNFTQKRGGWPERSDLKESQ